MLFKTLENQSDNNNPHDSLAGIKQEEGGF